MPPDASETPFDAAEFVVVDLETTGTGPARGDRVTEAAAVLVRGREIQPLFTSLVNPGQPIPWFITQLTGIDDAMVRDAPTFPEIAGELAAHLAGRVFVAHNAAFDWGFLDAEFARIAPGGLGALVTQRLCTVRLARRVLRHLPRRNLDAVCAHSVSSPHLDVYKRQEVLRARRAESPERIVDGVFALLEGHMGGVAPPDDQAVLVLRA